MSISSLRFAISRQASSSSSSSSFKDLATTHVFGLTTSSFLWSKNKPYHTNPKLKQKLCVRNSAQEIPQTLEEDSKFVPLEPEDPRFGPPVLLLLGFQFHEAQKIQELLKELDGEFMEIVFCTEDMIPRSLWEAVNTKQPDLKRVKIAESLPRICFLSGLTGEEMMMFIDAFPETGLEPVVFAAMVPNSADKPISELMEEIMGDHELLVSESQKRFTTKVPSFSYGLESQYAYNNQTLFLYADRERFELKVSNVEDKRTALEFLSFLQYACKLALDNATLEVGITQCIQCTRV